MFHRVFQPAQLSTAVPWSPAHPRTFTIPTDRLQDPAAAGQDSPCLCPTVHSLPMQTLPKAFATQKALKHGVRRPDSSQMCMGFPSQGRNLVGLHTFVSISGTQGNLSQAQANLLCALLLFHRHIGRIFQPQASTHPSGWFHHPQPPAKVNPSGFQPGFRCRSCENNANAAQIV